MKDPEKSDKPKENNPKQVQIVLLGKCRRQM
jgi:hypothetical protein